MLSVLVPAQAWCTGVWLQQGASGYTGTTDAWLDESQSHDNYGGLQTFTVKYSSGVSDTTVIKFDLTGVIPPGQTMMLSAGGLLILRRRAAKMPP
jgi:hypothetical protein